MDYKTKRRLIIAIIIIALVVIFLPIPFTHHKQPVTSTFKQIPNPPKVEKPTPLAKESSQAIINRFKAQGPMIPESSTASLNTSPSPSVEKNAKNKTQNAQSVQQAQSPTAANVSGNKDAQTVAAAKTQAPGQTPSQTQTPSQAPKQTPAQTQVQTQASVPASTPTKNLIPTTAQSSANNKVQAALQTTQKTNTVRVNKTALQQPAVAKVNAASVDKTALQQLPPVKKAALPVSKHKQFIKRHHRAFQPDSSPVINSYSQLGHKSILVHQDALGALPEIDIRKLNSNSGNLVSEKRRVAIAKKQAVAWVIQLASFDTIPQARKLVVNLRESGYVAFIQSATVHKKLKHRVYVGPFTRDQQAEAMLHNIDKKLRMHGYIHHFEPTVMIP